MSTTASVALEQSDLLVHQPLLGLVVKQIGIWFCQVAILPLKQSFFFLLCQCQTSQSRDAKWIRAPKAMVAIDQTCEV